MQTINKTLSEAEIAQYHRDGCVLIENFYDPADLDRINAELDRVIANQQDGVTKDNWVMSLAMQSKMISDVCRDERILDLISPIVYPGISIYSAKMTNKLPGDSQPCHWHQDDSYYIKNQESNCRMSIFLPLDDVEIKDGALQVIPGSHKSGIADYRPEGYGHCRNRIPDDLLDMDKRIYVPMKKGDILLFSALLYHGSDQNLGDKERRVFIVSYQEGTAEKGNGPQYELLRKP